MNKRGMKEKSLIKRFFYATLRTSRKTLWQAVKAEAGLQSAHDRQHGPGDFASSPW